LIPSASLIQEKKDGTVAGSKSGMMLIGQASESRLFTFSDETKNKLRKFRLGTSRAKDPQAIICKVESSFQSCC
jgi:hypothetical protein